jgi:quercetin dioxygenase-like cupin family protein
VQDWGGEKRKIKPGDVVWIPPGVKHWHGATATNAMGHIAIQELSMAATSIGWRRLRTSNMASGADSTRH